jgi:hypothetical protein
MATIITTSIIAGTSSSLFVQRVEAQVDTNDISNGAVTSPKIRDGEVRSADIADGAVTTDKIRPGAVITESLADNSVTSDKIADGSIMLEDLSTTGGLGGDNQGVSHVTFNTCSIDFGPIAAQKATTALCPVPGVQVGDHVVATSQESSLDIVTQSASVNGTELVRIEVWNPTFKSVDPPNVTWALIAFRT